MQYPQSAGFELYASDQPNSAVPAKQLGVHVADRDALLPELGPTGGIPGAHVSPCTVALVTAEFRAIVGAVLLDLAVSPLFVWGSFSDRLSDEIDVPAGSLGLAYAVGLAAFTVGVLAGGRIADRIAPRPLTLLVACGVVAGLGLTSVAQAVAVIVIGFGVLLGLATGLGYATAVRVAATVVGRRGSALALVVSAYAAGAVVLTPIVNMLWDRIGRTATFAALAVVLGVLLVGASALLPGTDGSTDAPRPSTMQSSVRGHGRAIVGAWAMFALGSAPALIAFGHAGGLARSADLVVIAVVLLNAGNLAGRLLAGPIADRVGHVLTLHATALVLVLALLLVAVFAHPAATLAGLLVLGTQYGAVSVLVPLVVADAVPSERFGTAYGLVFSGWGVAGLLGPLAAGWIGTSVGYPTVATALVGIGLAFWVAVWATTTDRAVG